MNPSEKHILEIDSVELSFGDRVILSSVYLAVETGGATALLGRNGSGTSRRRRVENSIKSILNKYSLTPGLHWEIKLLNISDILMWLRLQ